MLAWAEGCRSVTLAEENWHAFNKGTGGKGKSWATQFPYQAACQVLECHSRRWSQLGLPSIDE
eukprot:7033186-Alexandrium_andersonii.AAC.1